MSGTTRSFHKAGALALSLALVGLISSAVNAASINYGNFGPVAPGVTFSQVTESSVGDPVPLYGPPTPFSVGLNFNPIGFVATSANGGADLTDGQLNFSVNSPANIGITGIGLSESGDFSLVGAGGAATKAQAGAIMRVTISQINGINVAPILLPAANATVAYNLATNPGLVQPWDLGVFKPIALGPGQRVTKLDVVINNQLVSTSEAGSVSFIAKKDFIIDVNTDVPEPSTVALVGMALCSLGAVARKRS